MGKQGRLSPNAVGLGIIFTLILVAFLYVILVTRGDEPKPAQSSSPSSQVPAERQSSRSGTYVEYSEQRLAAADGSRWLFFHAGWCPQCRALEQDIKKFGVPAGVTILKVDYDTATDLKKKYGVTLQTTFVSVDKQGNELEKFVAYDDPSLAAVVKALDE